MFPNLVKRKPSIIIALNVLSYALAAFSVYATWEIVRLSDTGIQFVLMARQLGQASLVLFLLTVLPGIMRRFGFGQLLLSKVLMLFRRQLGVLMFSMAFAHYTVTGLAPMIAAGGPPAVVPTGVMMGSLSFMLLLPLFATSNDWAQRRLGANWSRLHTLIYVAIWVILLHVALVVEEVNIWDILIGTFAVLELVSLIYASIRKKNSPVRPTGNVSVPATGAASIAEASTSTSTSTEGQTQ
jgi:sulfoxide reductase heme-binding subunit YedZ